MLNAAHSLRQHNCDDTKKKTLVIKTTQIPGAFPIINKGLKECKNSTNISYM